MEVCCVKDQVTVGREKAYLPVGTAGQRGHLWEHLEVEITVDAAACALSGGDT